MAPSLQEEMVLWKGRGGWQLLVVLLAAGADVAAPTSYVASLVQSYPRGVLGESSFQNVWSTLLSYVGAAQNASAQGAQVVLFPEANLWHFYTSREQAGNSQYTQDLTQPGTHACDRKLFLYVLQGLREAQADRLHSTTLNASMGEWMETRPLFHAGDSNSLAALEELAARLSYIGERDRKQHMYLQGIDQSLQQMFLSCLARSLNTSIAVNLLDTKRCTRAADPHCPQDGRCDGKFMH